MPFNSTVSFVAQLSYARRDFSNGIVLGEPLKNRPWDWMENVTEDVNDGVGVNETLNTSVHDSGSISLSRFETRITSDLNFLASPTLAGSHSFDDALYSESVFSRDWRESRFFLDETQSQSSITEDQNDHTATASLPFNVTPSFPRISPSSMSSKGGSSAPVSQKPSPQASSAGRKRKAHSPVAVEDEPNQDSGPQITGKRLSRSAGTSRTRAKK